MNHLFTSVPDFVPTPVMPTDDSHTQIQRQENADVGLDFDCQRIPSLHLQICTEWLVSSDMVWGTP